MDQVDVAVVGAGAAGLAAARRVAQAGATTLVLEARPRIGGRGLTCEAHGIPYDLGCGWLHSGDVNPWTALAGDLGFTVDRSEPPWGRQTADLGFPPADQASFRAAFDAFYERLDAVGLASGDRPSGDHLEPQGRWTPLMNAMSGYISGAPYSELSAHDHALYADTGVNWRVVEGYGRLIATFGADALVRLETPVTLIDHRGPRVRLHTPSGVLEARTVIVTVPSSVLAAGTLRFQPDVPERIAAAAELPLGLADKVFLLVARPELLPPEGHLLGNPHDAGTGSFHLRPFGRPVIEVFYGGERARALEEAGPEAAAGLAVDEIVGLVGGALRDKLAPLDVSAWGRDPWSLGSYSYARPGATPARRTLAAPVDERLFFAGEATSVHSFSTAHGAYETGLRAADEALAALRSRPA